MSKWLIRKTSGSRSKWKSKGDYSDQRASRKDTDLDDLPQRESIGNKNYHHTYLDTSLVKRWLHSKVDQDFDDVYSEFLTRIQPKYLDQYRDCIYQYVVKKENVFFQDNGEVWGHWFGKEFRLPYSWQAIFYVDPNTNKLQRAI